jgi:hypothetical protein
VLGGALVLGLLVGCSAPAPAAPTSVPEQPAVQSTAVSVVAVAPPTFEAPLPVLPVPTLRPDTVASPVPLPLSVVAGHSGADVRATFDFLLQEQVFLLASAMDASNSARLDELIGTTSALDQNSLAIAQLIGAARGQTAAQALADAWRAQTTDLVQLGNLSADQLSTADLDKHDQSIAAQLALGDLAPSTVEDLLRQRNQAVRDVAAAIVRHDPSDTTARVQAAVQSSDDLGRPVAVAISATLPGQVPGPTDGLDVDLRLTLARVFQTHVYLAGAALEAANDGRNADLQAQLAAEDANAAALSQQLAAAWSPDIASGIADRLRGETRTLVSIASGGNRRAAATTLDRLRGEMDSSLSSANPLLPPALLGQQLRASDQPLLTAADGFVARDFVGAFTRLREAARQTQKPAATLALSIVDRYPARYLVLPTPVPVATPGAPPQ